MRTLSLLAAIFLALILPAAPASADMVLGTNFWNLGWHKSSDCFLDFRNVKGTNPWNPQFLRDIAVFKSLRFMDWDNTNNSTRQTWSQRPLKTKPLQNPVAYEWMINLCNHKKADMWVTIPHRTISRSTGNEPCDYALRLCILVKHGVDMKTVNLKPLYGKLATMTAAQFVAAGGVKVCGPLEGASKLYIEYSNETWNGQFQQATYACDEGLALKLDANRWTAGFRFHAWAAIRMFRAADLVFGPGSPRVVKVLATQAGNSWIAGQHIAVMNNATYNPWKTKASAIAIAPYFGNGVDGAASNAVAQLRSAIQTSITRAAAHKKIADTAGLKLIAYEGGQHVTTNAHTINRNPVMNTLYNEYLQAMSPYFTHFSHYCHVGGAKSGGAWGSMEYTGQPLTEAHKYRALKTWAAAHPR